MAGRGENHPNLLYRIASIEKAGTGIRRMSEEAERHGSPPSELSVNGFFAALFRPVTGEVTGEVAGEVTGHVTGHVTAEVLGLLELLGSGSLRRSEIRAALNLSSRAHLRERYLDSALASGLIEMTEPDKPRSSKQRYRLSETGRKVLSGEPASP